VCPQDEYRSTPVFRYVGCGYTITPTSTYPPLKASSVWRWVPKASDWRYECDEGILDPYGVHCTVARVAKDALEYLGQTVLITGKDGQRHFADIFGYDPSRGLLFGWLRSIVHGHNDYFSAFALPGYTDGCVPDASLPPFKRITVESIGFAQGVAPPPPPPSQRLALVPVKCRQIPTRYSPNLVPDFVVQVSSEFEEDALSEVIINHVLHHLIEHRLLHPLFIQALQDTLVSDQPAGQLIKLEKTGLDPLWLAIKSRIARGEAPADFGLLLEWSFGYGVHQDNWQAYNNLPALFNRQQPAESAWRAPLDWFEPTKPTVDPSGQYQKIDVMSYVGNGHVLPPWSSYPPAKTRSVWSRLSWKRDGANNPELKVYTIKYTPASSLLEVLGQTAVVPLGIDSLLAAEIFGVDEERGLAFGFKRFSARDEFICFQVETLMPEQPPQVSVSLHLSKIQLFVCRDIGIPIKIA
jgi:hypothetical protein